jgi:hypothetical protein
MINKHIQKFDVQMKHKKQEIDYFKKKEAQRLVKNFYNMNPNNNSKKQLLNLIANSLFGESAHQVEFYKSLKACQVNLLCIMIFRSEMKNS